MGLVELGLCILMEFVLGFPVLENVVGDDRRLLPQRLGVRRLHRRGFVFFLESPVPHGSLARLDSVDRIGWGLTVSLRLF